MSPAYKNWKDYIDNYPKVEPIKDPDAEIYRKLDSIKSFDEHESEISNQDTLNRNEKKALIAQEYALEQGTQVNFFLAGQHAMGALSKDANAQTEIVLGACKLKGAVMTLLGKRMFAKRGKNGSRSPQQDLEEVVLRREAEIEGPRLRKMKRELEEAREEIQDMDEHLKDAWRELKEEQ